MATLEQARSLVTLLENELLARASEVDRLNGFYRGEQPLRFASPEFREYFAARYREFADNWTQVVADSPVERLTVTGIKPAGDDRADRDLWRVWQVNGLDTDSQLGFLGAGTAARSFVLVWGDPDNPDMPEVTFEDARECVVAYEPGSRRRRRAALKRWQDGNDEYATLYLRDEVWKFRRPLLRHARSVNLAGVDEVLKWEPREVGDEPNPQPNPMGAVPVVELANRPLLADDPLSDVAGTVAMQDAINLLWSQLFTAADYAAFPQRVIMGADMPTTPILDERGQVIGERPVPLEKFAVDRVLWITGDQAKIAEWSAANLSAYTDVIEVAVGHIAAQTRTPQHYLVGRMANLSGDALIAAETGLVKRVEEKQMWFGMALREMFRLIALAQGDEGKAQAIAAGAVLWADAESRSQSQLADALMKLKQIGFPFEWIAARYGLTPTEIADMLAMREREQLADPIGAIAAEMGRGGFPAGPDPVAAIDDQP
ncbi:phage portal protein [Nocardiopsis sp. NPDC101807]|uniref:phage portal protein n=1 Tax=Nocardiopsis sp. NPDC101807 TaxID=3364339 RepID=UPI0037F3F042